jgi:hypothetical protein
MSSKAKTRSREAGRTRVAAAGSIRLLCREDQVLNQNLDEIRQLAQDALEDAV